MKNFRLLSQVVFPVFVFAITTQCSNDETNIVDDNSSTAQFPCENGIADIYPCNNYDLMAHIPIADLGETGVQGNDSWGWTDTTAGKE